VGSRNTVERRMFPFVLICITQKCTGLNLRLFSVQLLILTAAKYERHSVSLKGRFVMFMVSY
jgi:hypothetical protein